MKKLLTIILLLPSFVDAQTNTQRIVTLESKMTAANKEITLLKKQLDSVKSSVICFDSNHVVTRKNDTTIVSMKPKKIF